MGGWNREGGDGGKSGVALIKFPGGFDLLQLTKVQVSFHIFHTHVLNLHLCSFRSMLISLWVSISDLLASCWYTFFRS